MGCGKSEVIAIEHKSNWLRWLVSSCYVQAENHDPQDCGVEFAWVGNRCSSGVWNEQGNSSDPCVRELAKNSGCC